MRLLEMSLSGSLLILVVVLLRTLALHHLPKTTFLALWAVAVARLLLPFSLPSAFSIYTLLGRIPPFTPARQAVDLPLPLPPVTAATGPELLTHIPPQIPVLPILWGMGTVACALFFLLSYRRCTRSFATAQPVEGSEMDPWLAAHPLARGIEVRRSKGISAPLTYGILHPVILLPQSLSLEGETLGYVLLHEYIHIRRWDALTKLLLCATLSLHWWNPLVWAMVTLANRDLELSCDERVLRTLGAENRGAYARALIDLEELRSGPQPLCSSFSRTATEERILSIMKLKKHTATSVLLALLLVGTTATAFATSPPSISAATTAYASVGEDGKVQTLTREELQSIYGPHGLTFLEDGTLTYNGEQVRSFWDGVELGDGVSISRYQYQNQNGTIDLRTRRTPIQNADGSTDPMGTLEGIEPYTPTEEEARGTTTDSTAEAITSVTLTDNPGGKSFSEYFKDYTAYGITYKAGENGGRGDVSYNGKPVGTFYDQKADGSIFLFQSDSESDLTVCTTYDENGKCTGVRTTTQSELFPTVALQDGVSISISSPEAETITTVDGAGGTTPVVMEYKG